MTDTEKFLARAVALVGYVLTLQVMWLVYGSFWSFVVLALSSLPTVWAAWGRVLDKR